MLKTFCKSSLRLRVCLTVGLVGLTLLAGGIRGGSARNVTLSVGPLHGTGIVSRGVSVQTTPEWISQPSGTSAVLLGVAFTDSQKGYAVGTGGVIRVTTNGGRHVVGANSGTTDF